MKTKMRGRGRKFEGRTGAGTLSPLTLVTLSEAFCHWGCGARGKLGGEPTKDGRHSQERSVDGLSGLCRINLVFLAQRMYTGRVTCSGA